MAPGLPRGTGRFRALQLLRSRRAEGARPLARGRVKLLPTPLVGRYPHPEWLTVRARRPGGFRRPGRAKECCGLPEPYLTEAQNDATLPASAPRKTPVSTSSPTVKSAARAIRIGLRRRS